ncbi:MAG: sensor domain-containing diguanylate cyclase [Planctomycetes bacterium]|nr:sensor domain-containing diguanylate cyclase [Planctomycetota bacterium]
MIEPPLAPDEMFRLNSLRALHALDTPLEERFERITRLATRLLDVPIVAVSLIDADRQWFKSVQGVDVDGTSRDISFCGHTILKDQVMVVPDARSDPRFASNPLVTGDPGIVFYAGHPLRAPDGARVATLCVIDTRPRTLSEDEVALLRDLAAVAETELTSVVLNSVQADLVSQLESEQRQALLDPLTRVWNRAGIFSILDGQIDRCRAGEAGFAVIMADLDHFKRVNDAHGHLTGDEVLRAAAKRMLAGIRGRDAIGRFGGEEFLVVLGDCAHPDEVWAVADRLRRRVAESPVVHDGAAIDVTTSVGACFVPSGAVPSPEALVRVADDALYSAKRHGRDRVELGDVDDCGVENAAA